MVKLRNVYDNSNIILSDEKGIFRVLEHKVDQSAKTMHQAEMNFYFSRTGVNKKQLLIRLKNESVCVNPGLLMFTCGNIEVKTNVRGVGDLINKAISSSVTGEGMIKPKYHGTGYVMLDHTYRYILLEQTNKENGMIISDATFLACSGGVNIKTMPVSSLTSAALGREGVFNLLLKGDGIVAFTSPVPKEDITIVELQNDVLKVDGNYAIAWSESLSFAVENPSADLFSTSVSQEGYVNVYRGTGQVLLSSVLPQNLDVPSNVEPKF